MSGIRFRGLRTVERLNGHGFGWLVLMAKNLWGGFQLNLAVAVRGLM